MAYVTARLSRMVLTLDGSCLRIAVHTVTPSAGRQTTPGAHRRGLGLALIDSLATEWGTDIDDGFGRPCGSRSTPQICSSPRKLSPDPIDLREAVTPAGLWRRMRNHAPDRPSVVSSPCSSTRGVEDL